MKLLFITPLVLMSLVSSPSWGLSMDDLVHREGLYYKKFTDVPFTGEIDEGPHKGKFKDGFPDGHWILYYEDGELLEKGDFKDGDKVGLWVSYHKNGQLRSRGDFKNGRKEGEWVFFDKDGTKQMSELKIGETVLNEGSGVYRDGIKVSD